MSDSGDQNSQTDTVVLTAEVDPLVGREVGGYVIEAALGEGGMGLVYKARHPFLNRRFAIKVVRPEFAGDDQLSSNFVREAQTLSGLKHPHIIDIVGFGQLDLQRQYMVMEFLEGHTLQHELNQHGRLGVARALDVADPILDALEAAHSIDVIHRDLKPANVFVSTVSGGTEVVKLLDFGLAKLQPQVLTGKGLPAAPADRSMMAGTPEYIAPEQAQGQPASKRSDLYSFGVMLFEMLTGEQPFAASLDEDDRIYSLLQRHIHERAPGLSGPLAGDFPLELEILVGELLEKKPEHRPQSATEVRQRLARLRRALHREETQQVNNPLLLVAERADSASTIPLSSTPPAAVAAGQSNVDPEPLLAHPPRRGRAAVVIGLALLLLAGGLWWSGAPDPVPAPVSEVGAEPSKVEPAVAHPPTGPAAAVPVPPRVASPDADIDLEPLPRVPTPKTTERLTLKRRTTLEITQFTCEPNERWRAASRAHLQELQQAAAASEDPGSWPRFEQAETTLTTDIAGAETGAQCEAVDRKIRQLAKELTR